MRREDVIREFTEWPAERCSRQAAKVERLIARLREGVVTFRYIKADGTIRSATGTLRSEFFDKIPQGKRAVPLSNVPYWDMERMQFRSFNVWALL